MKKIVNTTPHDINVVLKDGVWVFPKSETPARCSEVIKSVESMSGVVNDTNIVFDVVEKSFGQVENLPEPAPDTLYIVSAIVKQALPQRQDLLLVNDTVRNEQGQIVGCRGFAR